MTPILAHRCGNDGNMLKEKYTEVDEGRIEKFGNDFTNFLIVRCQFGFVSGRADLGSNLSGSLALREEGIEPRTDHGKVVGNIVDGMMPRIVVLKNAFASIKGVTACHNVLCENGNEKKRTEG
jgi:hypothetical protein